MTSIITIQPSLTTADLQSATRMTTIRVVCYITHQLHTSCISP